MLVNNMMNGGGGLRGHTPRTVIFTLLLPFSPTCPLPSRPPPASPAASGSLNFLRKVRNLNYIYIYDVCIQVAPNPFRMMKNIHNQVS